MLTHILVLPITHFWPSVMYKCNGHTKMCLDIIHPSIHLSIYPSFLRKSWIRPRTDKGKKEKEADSIFRTVCNKDSLLTYLTLSGPRDEVGMYYQMYLFFWFKILIT
jgi:hypothetical protein